MLAHVGGGHDAPSLLTSWSLDPWAIVGVGLLAVVYGLGMRSPTGRRPAVFPRWRPVMFYAGLGVILLALISPIDRLAEDLFTMHMVQHMLLMAVGAPLLLLGTPFVPLLRGLPLPLRRRVVIPLGQSRRFRRFLRLLTHPLVTWALYAAVVVVWHMPTLFDAALGNQGLHYVQHLTFTGAALLFWWNVVDPTPLCCRAPYLLRLPYLFLAAIPSSILGAFLSLSSGVWYAFYEKGPSLWGLSPLDDQVLGGIIMWVPGGMVYLLAMAIVFFVMAEREEGGARVASRRGAGAVQR